MFAAVAYKKEHSKGVREGFKIEKLADIQSLADFFCPFPTPPPQPPSKIQSFCVDSFHFKNQPGLTPTLYLVMVS